MEMHDPEDVSIGERSYNTALASLGPRHPLTLEAEYNYSWILRWRGQFEKSLQFAEPAARGLQEIKGQSDPKSMFAAYNYASCLYELHRYKEAADVFGPLVEVRNRVLGPTHVDSLYSAWRYADSLQKIGDDAAALKVLDSVRAKLKEIEAAGSIRRAGPLGNMENLYVRLKHTERAVEIQEVMYRMFSKALDEGDSHNIDFAFLRNFVLELALSPTPQLRDPKRAMEIATKACELTDSKNSDVVMAAVFAHVGNGDYKSAIEILNKLGDRGNLSAQNQYYLALIMLKAGDVPGYRDACQSMLKQFAASSLDDELHWLTWTCALHEASVDDLNLPLQIAKKLVAQSPHNESYLSGLGILLYRAGSYEAAEKILAEAIADNKDTGATTTSAAYPKFFLAMTKSKLSDPAEAKRLLAEIETAVDIELKSNPLWNRQATLELFRQEAESLIGQTSADASLHVQVCTSRFARGPVAST